MADPAYAAWKTSLLADTLSRLGYTAPLAPIARTPPGARRRMDLAIRRDGRTVRIGLHQARSHDIVDMHACPVLHRSLFDLIQHLRPVLAGLDGLKREGSAVVNLLDTGPDVLLRTDRPLTAADRTALATLGLPRIAWAATGSNEAEPACVQGPTSLAFSGQATPVPPGAFLQASPQGEAAIRNAVLGMLPPMKARSRIIELFAGVGTLTHALAGHARVQAYEGDAAAIRALRATANPRVEALHRDLARQPLQPPELKGAAAIVLDPPHSGAPAQMPTLATSGAPIIYVTCNPAALLRDGRALIAAGYEVTAAAVIDQFLWSARVEGVVAFKR